MSRRSEREVFVLLPPDLLPLTAEDPRKVGSHVIIGRVGAGRAGTVYAAVNPTITADTVVALKTLDPAHLTDEHTRTELDQRLRALVPADSRCYVPPLSFDAFATPPWLSMPYVSGIPLAQYVRKRGPMALGRLIALSAGLAEGMGALHREGIAHGDLKPSNILLGSKGPRMLDCALPGDESMMRQSAAWLAPERHQGAAPSSAGDVFAWGAVVAFSGTGRLPFGLGEPHALVERVLDGRPDLDGLPGELLETVTRCLGRDPEGRPSVRELIASSIGVWEATARGSENGGVPGTAVTRLLNREWPGIVEPVRIPRVVHLDDGTVRHAGDEEHTKPSLLPRPARRRTGPTTTGGLTALGGVPGASSYSGGTPATTGTGPQALPADTGAGLQVRPADTGGHSGPVGAPPSAAMDAGPGGGGAPPYAGAGVPGGPGDPVAPRFRVPGRGSGGRRPGGPGRTRVLLIAGGVLVLLLVAGGVWALSSSLFGGSSADPGPTGTADDKKEKAAPTTMVVRFAQGTQESTEGPWVFTEVAEKAKGDPGNGAEVTQAQWSERWVDAKGAKPQKADIDPDAEVTCARFCLLPGQVEADKKGRGTYTVKSSDFTNYLAWGEDVIVEVEFAAAKGDGPREIVRITELYAPKT